MTLAESDWEALDRLRALFLEGKAVRASYWRVARDLVCYDATYGERIGWKWDAVLRGLAASPQSNWRPPRGPIFDFGCGSGIAGRRVVAAFGAQSFTRLCLYDKSRLAEEFARDAALGAFPGLEVVRASPDEVLDAGKPVTLVVSHVLNELSPTDYRRLLGWARRAAAILWVEPGTFPASRALISVREELKSKFSVLRPCTHRGTCGLMMTGREGDWCHHFAVPPKGLSTDPFWTRFARQAGIDLRSLPYSHLVLSRLEKGYEGGSPRWERVLGRPKAFKGYVELLSCGEGGVRSLVLQRRSHPGLAERLEDATEAILADWKVEQGRILGGEICEPESARGVARAVPDEGEPGGRTGG